MSTGHWQKPQLASHSDSAAAGDELGVLALLVHK
jgi:hypothetical protein